MQFNKSHSNVVDFFCHEDNMQYFLQTKQTFWLQHTPPPVSIKVFEVWFKIQDFIGHIFIQNAGEMQWLHPETM